MTRAAIVLLLLVAVGIAYVLSGRETAAPIERAETTTSQTTSTTVLTDQAVPSLGDRFGELVDAMKPKPAPVRERQKATVITAAGDLQDLIRSGFARFGTDVADQAVRVAGCECCGDPTGATLNPAARNGAHYGLFQISRLYHDARVRRLGFSWDDMLTAGPNIAVAVDLFAEKKRWAPTWSCAWAA